MAKSSPIVAILSFDEEYKFLSNFFLCPIKVGDVVYRSAENAYQAMKFGDSPPENIATCSPALARKLGRSAKLPLDWEVDKDDIMLRVLSHKFTQNEELRRQLINTGDSLLVEGNTWHDTYWGFSGGRGQNRLGYFLMEVRHNLRSKF